MFVDDILIMLSSESVCSKNVLRIFTHYILSGTLLSGSLNVLFRGRRMLSIHVIEIYSHNVPIALVITFLNMML